MPKLKDWLVTFARKLKNRGQSHFTSSLVPATAALVLTTFAPSVAATSPQTVTPSPRTLTTTGYPPTVTGPAPLVVTPTTAVLTVTELVPIVTFSLHQLVTPATKALTLTGHAPTINGAVGVIVPTRALTVTRFAPTITTPNPQTVTPTTRALTVTPRVPSVTSANHLVVTPTTRALTTARFAPTVTALSNQLVTPAKKTLTITRYAPTVSAAAGGSYYIAPGGSNSTGSGTIGSPWRTIGKFLTVASPGDTLYCRGGTYQGSDIGGTIVTQAGTSSQRITIRNYTGEVPVFAGGGGTPTGPFINHQDSAAYLTYHGLTVSQWVPTGTGAFTSTGNSNDTPHDIIIENCVISLSSAGISGSDDHTIYVGGGRNFTIRGNELIGGGAVGDDGNGVVIYDETYTPHDITITNNLFRNWNSQAVQLWMSGGYNWNVTWNTFIGNPTFNIDARRGATGIVVRNNIGDGSAATPIYNPYAIIDTNSNNYWGLTLTGPNYAPTGAAIGGAHDGSNAGWTRPTPD